MKSNKTANFAALMALGNSAEMFFYDEIGGWGIWAADVALALRQYDALDTLTMRFHSPGGDMQEAAAIRGLLETARDNGQIRALNAIVDGRAYSAATYIALAAEQIEMNPLGLWMIHRPRVALEGNADEIRQAADVADQLEATVNAVYQVRTGASIEQVQDWVRGDSGATDGTIFTAQAALDANFVDAITGDGAGLESLDEEFENKLSDNDYSTLFKNSSEKPAYLNYFCRTPKQLTRMATKEDQAILKARYIEAQRVVAELLG